MTNPDLSGVQHAMYRLTAPIKDYAWGSTTLLAELTGSTPTTTPQAEMWFGTHPATPTLLDTGEPLAQVVDLPFLVKLLAAAQPLSIQAHPTIPQAKAGFAAENAAGLPLDHPERTYRDANHKPEMIVALTDFTAMAGFRDPYESAQTFATLARLVSDRELSAVLTSMTQQLTDGQIKAVFGQLVEPDSWFSRPHGWTRAIFTAVAQSNIEDPHLTNALAAAAIHQDDPGALITLLMNLVHLTPGESLFIPDGTIHAYVAGLGLEVMATSDNVIRGGLTIKHVDLIELDRVVSYKPAPPPFLNPNVHSFAGITTTEFTPPVSDFALTRYDLDAAAELTVTPQSPCIAICTAGAGRLTANDTTVEVTPGDGLYLPSTQEPIELTTTTGMTLFIARQP